MKQCPEGCSVHPSIGPQLFPNIYKFCPHCQTRLKECRELAKDVVKNLELHITNTALTVGHGEKTSSGSCEN